MIREIVSSVDQLCGMGSDLPEGRGPMCLLEDNCAKLLELL